MRLFEAQSVELAGINLIEASAGTGKTFTLAELYCRLVTEKQLEVSQILVVTYTRAATEELRARLRQRLVAEKQALSQSSDSDSATLKRLKLAIQSFDEAAIFTIHGFCQRALQDFAFESGHFFDMEMITDEEDIKLAVVDDFWRHAISTCDNEFANFLLKKKITPDSLLKSLGSLAGKPYLEYLPLPDFDENGQKAAASKAFNDLKQVWYRERQDIEAFLLDTSQMSQSSYKIDKVKIWLQEMDALLMLATAPMGLSENFNKFTEQSITKGVKKAGKVPELAVWPVCEKLSALDAALQTTQELKLQHLHRQLALYLSEELPKRKLENKLQAFDDLLINLQRALHGNQGKKLAAQIREQFNAALIDEFQDTDPIQYDCFKTIFTDRTQPVFFVGDPKQAIYSFRGADIFTYLNAKKASENQFSLDTNWRSHKRLVDAVNTLFGRLDNPFIYESIPFHPVKSANQGEPGLTVAGQTPPPMSLLWLADNADKAVIRGDMLTAASRVTAKQIADLMYESSQDLVSITDTEQNTRPLNGGDIAVLVRSHTQATAIQQALRDVGINSVQQSRDNVFDSEQAVMLERVLQAIANPANDSLVATALSTPLFTVTALELFQLQQDDNAWLKQVDFFISLQERWQQSGFITMLRTLMTELDVQRRFLQQPDGERQLTNLMHLAELVQAFASRRNSTIEAILTWYAAQRQAGAAGLDTAQIRLESDEQLVKVITIHTSKGLEYPVVFCPFLWHHGKPKQSPAAITFHKGDDNQACVAFGEPGFSEAAPIVEVEEKAEELRLLYVALTRARERCVILWGAAKESENTAMFRLLHGELGSPEPLQMLKDIQQLAVMNPDSISTELVYQANALTNTLKKEKPALFNARDFSGKILSPKRVGSFSGLTRGHNVEKPDYDADTLTLDMPVVRVDRQDRFGFPRGATAGVCLHSLFEHWDFKSTGTDFQQLIEKVLNQYGIETSWSGVVENWLEDVVNTPLDDSLRLSLAALESNKCLDEMAFYFPVDNLTLGRLKTSLTPFINEMPTLAQILPQLNFESLHGYMKGFVDLVFEFEGRFYVADYKSNHLGDKEADYAFAQLELEMVSHAYPFQYLIYSLALHRYLKTRVPDYDLGQHYGGVYYLFIRGMRPDWGQAGVYFHRPSTELLEALDACMSQEQS